MKKLTALLMVLCLSVVAVGCGGDEGRTGGTTATSGGTTAPSGDGASTEAH